MDRKELMMGNFSGLTGRRYDERGIPYTLPADRLATYEEEAETIKPDFTFESLAGILPLPPGKRGAISGEKLSQPYTPTTDEEFYKFFTELAAEQPERTRVHDPADISALMGMPSTEGIDKNNLAKMMALKNLAGK